MTDTVEAEKYQPEWEKPCWIVAIKNTLGLSEDAIKKLARKNGWDGKSEGLELHKVIQIVWDVIGKMPDLTLTKFAKGKTPRSLSSSSISKGKTGIVFTRAHVMPMVHGVVSNFNGHGEEAVVAVATYEHVPFL